ncbi:hypothetical protein S245_066080, partial [Arachis hypogaea]
ATAAPNRAATIARSHCISQPPPRHCHCHRRARLLCVRRCRVLCRRSHSPSSPSL